MENLRDDLVSVLERIGARLSELESRVSSLEQHPGPNGFVRHLPMAPAIAESHPLAELPSFRALSAVPAIGKLFLGLAGGYLLRALAESGGLPRTATVLLAMSYAVGWLVWAARISAQARFSGVVCATTAALLFSPMLWEMTVGFKVLPDHVSAALLAAFVMLAFVLAWRHKLTAIVWVATSLPAVVALVLLVETRDPAPFTSALLLIALLAEYAGLHGRWRSLRPMAALLADCAILILILIYSGQTEAPAEYKPIVPAALLALTATLLAIYGTSVTVSTVVLRQKIGVFEIGQAMAAFAVAITGILRVTHDTAASPTGVFCLLLAGGCYLAATTSFADRTQEKNYRVFTAWSAALVVLGTLLLFSTTTSGILLSLAAAAATFSSVRLDRWNLGLQGAFCLAIAAYFSGLWDYMTHAMVGPLSSLPGWSQLIGMFCSALCCAIVWWKGDQGAQRMQSALRLFFSFTAISSAMALTVALAWMSLGGVALSLSVLAAIRTLVLWMAILALSFIGARWNRQELIWIAYAAIAFCTLKLLFEDLRYGTAGSLAASLFLYGTIWVIIPRWMRSPGR